MEREEEGNGGMLYHEEQESKLCAVHCVNTVLQGPFFSEFDLAAMASDLDHREHQMMTTMNPSIPLGTARGPHHASHNVSLDGDFSIQVLQRAMEVWDLQVIPLDSPVAAPARNDPDSEKAFICHLVDHWFCIRKVNREWYNFDSLLPAPQHLSKFYLSAYMDSLKGFGWSIFLVRGNFPRECPLVSSEAPNGYYGQWLTPDDAERRNKSYSNSTPPPRRAQLNQQQFDQFNEPGDAELLMQFEDEDLKAAIAASLLDSSSTIVNKEANSPITNTGIVTQVESSLVKACTEADNQTNSSTANANTESSSQTNYSPSMTNTQANSQMDPSFAMAGTGAKSQIDFNQGKTNTSTENRNDSPPGLTNTEAATPEKADQN